MSYSIKSCGKRHSWCFVCQPSRGVKISAALMGNQHTKGHVLTFEHRAKISAGLRSYTKTLEHRMAISATQKGKPESFETRAKISAAGKVHAALDVECGCWVHSQNGHVSNLTWLLADALNKLGFIVQPEARVGRRSIDVLLIDEWIAFEADGRWWHEHNEIQRPGCYKARDQELLKIWNLPTVRLTEQEVHELARSLGEEVPLGR